MKTDVETLSPTRVRLTVEVPFAELQPSVDAAYRKIGRQVRVQGFRPGKVPARILDQRVGRPVVLEEAVQEALPRLYGDAVREADVAPMGAPAVDVTEFVDGQQLVFTAEVDIRPEVVLPDYQGRSVSVDDVTVTDEEVAEQLDTQRERFAVLTGVDRPAASGDYVSIDLAATVDGEPVPGGETTGMSYEVGSGAMLAGIDDVLEGMAEGDSSTFDSELVAGDFAGRTAQVAVTVRGVKDKELPPYDDDFARMASEFETLDELRGDIRRRLERGEQWQQGVQARDKLLDDVLEATDLALPESAVEAELSFRQRSMEQQLTEANLTMADYLASEARTEEELNDELRGSAAKAVKAQLVLDAIADKEELGVENAEISEQIVRSAQRAGVSPDQFAQQAVESGQLRAIVSDLRRGKALALMLETAEITDASGRVVDLEALREEHVHTVDGSEASDEQAQDAIEDGTTGDADEDAAAEGLPAEDRAQVDEQR